MSDKPTSPKLKLVEHNSNSTAMPKPEFTDTGILHIQKSSTIVGTNPRALSLLGYPFDFNFNDKQFLDVCESFDQKAWSDLVKTIESTVSVQFRAIFRTHSGGFCELSCMAVCETGASVIDLYVTQGQTPCSYLDEALTKLEFFDAFMNTELMDINIKDKELRYVATSKLFEKTFNLEKGAAIGKTPGEIYPEDFADHVASHDLNVLDGRNVVSQIDVVPFSDKHLLVQKFPIYKNKSVAGVGVFAVDVTALKVSEQRHIDSKNKFADYVELCSDVLWEVDQDWLVIESNISGTSNVSGISFKAGENLLTQLKDAVSVHSLLEEFLDSLVLEQVRHEIFQLKNGARIKLGIKPIQTETAADQKSTIYRGILTLLGSS